LGFEKAKVNYFKNMKWMNINFISQYGISGLLRLVIDLICTKLFISSKTRIIRRPVYIRGKKYIDFGENLTTGVAVRLDAFPEGDANAKCIIFGNNVQLNDYVHIAAVISVTIGNNVLIASKVFISDHNHGGYGTDGYHDSPDIAPILRPLRAKSVIIEDNVWIGELVSILPGVTIGQGAVIGAMSVVNKDIPPYCVAVGVPARVIKKYDPDIREWVETKN